MFRWNSNQPSKESETKTPSTRAPLESKGVTAARPNRLQARGRSRAPGPSRRPPRAPRGGRRSGRSDSSMNLTDIAKVATKAWQASKYIMSLINVETKVHDVVTTSTVSTTPNVYNLSNIAQGTDFNQRDGNSVLCQGLMVTITIAAPLTAAHTAFNRILIVVDHDQHGSDPALSDVLETVAADVSVCSPLLHFVSKRFSVLYDHVTSHCTSAASCSQTLTIPIRYNKHITYSSDLGIDSSNWEGAIYLYTIGTQATYPSAITIYSRLLFTDN